MAVFDRRKIGGPWGVLANPRRTKTAIVPFKPLCIRFTSAYEFIPCGLHRTYEGNTKDLRRSTEVDLRSTEVCRGRLEVYGGRFADIGGRLHFLQPPVTFSSEPNV